MATGRPSRGPAEFLGVPGSRDPAGEALRPSSLPDQDPVEPSPAGVGGDEPGTKPLVVFPAMTQEEWVAEYGGGLTLADVERQRREILDGDPPTSDEGS